MHASAKPADVLDQTIAGMLFSSRYRLGRGRPGEVIEGLSEARRAALRELRSDDIGPGHKRTDLLWFGYAADHKERIRQECLAFDRKLNQR